MTNDRACIILRFVEETKAGTVARYITRDIYGASKSSNHPLAIEADGFPPDFSTDFIRRKSRDARKTLTVADRSLSCCSLLDQSSAPQQRDGTVSTITKNTIK